MAPVAKSIELPNRVTISYVEQGAPSGVPVLLLHGVTDSWHSFDPVLPFLPTSIHAFALSQRGHGDSSRPETGYRFDDFASDVAAFMEALQIESAVIAGHSMGSAVAQRFAIDYPERTRGLVLIGSFASLQGNPGVHELWDSVISTMADPVDPEFVRAFQQSTLAQPVPPAFFETVVQESLKVPARVWKATFEGFLQKGFSDQVGNIRTPVLLVWGDQDQFCRRTDQDKLLASIEGSRLVVYPGAGHAVHWENPDRFASDMRAFIESFWKT